MKYLPKLAIHMEKHLGWAPKFCGVESLEISKADQTILARLMESQIRHQLVSSLGGGFRKGTMASTCLDARYFISSLCTTGTFQVTPWCWSTEEVSLSKSMPVVFKRNCLCLQNFFQQLNPHCLLHPELWGLILLALEPRG